MIGAVFLTLSAAVVLSLKHLNGLAQTHAKGVSDPRDPRILAGCMVNLPVIGPHIASQEQHALLTTHRFYRLKMKLSVSWIQIHLVGYKPRKMKI